MARSRRLPLIAGSAVVGLALLAGCGGGGTITVTSKGSTESTDTSGGAAAPASGAVADVASLRSAGKATAEVTSARFESVFADPDGTVYMKATGEMSGDRTHQATTISGSGLFGDDGADLTSELVVDGSTVYVGGTIFEQLGGLFGDEGTTNEGPTWYKIGVPGEAADLPSEFGIGSDVFGTQTAALLDGAYGDVTTVGTEEIRGASTTHYKVEIDPSKIEGDAGALSEMLGTATLPVEVWIDADGLVRRMQFVLDADDFGGSGAGEPESLVMSFEMWDVGADIEIDVPQNAKEFDLGDLFGEGG